MMAGAGRWLALCSAAWLVSGALGARYIFASSPSTQNVVWAKLPTFNDLTKEVLDVKQANVLIDGQGSKCTQFCNEQSDQGLKTPQGLAVFHHDESSATLYVSDPEAQNIYAYTLQIQEAAGFMSETPVASTQVKVREGVVAQWLATDGYGNLFYTDQGKVEMLSAENITAAKIKGELPEPQVLYSVANSKSVAGPAGVAADNFYVYWANQQGDATTGSVARGPERLSASQAHPSAPVTLMTDQYQAVAANVCLARDNLFFTGESNSLFAVKTSGGAIAEVNQNFTKPQGCVYDDESTLYVADEGANAVFSLPANFANLRTIGQVKKIMSVNAPSQLVVYSAWSVLS